MPSKQNWRFNARPKMIRHLNDQGLVNEIQAQDLRRLHWIAERQKHDKPNGRVAIGLLTRPYKGAFMLFCHEILARTRDYHGALE